MPKMFHRPSPKAEGQKVFIAAPCYTGPSAGFTFALFHTSGALSKAGIASELSIYLGDCHVDDARNRLVRDFLESDCTDFVFIDADLRWEPADFVRLLQFDCDVVGATYPFKADDTGFPVAMMPGEAWADKRGLVEVLALPTGFLRIKRHVLQTLADKAEKFHPKSDCRSDFPLIFERQIFNGFRRGGDYAFCHKWRELGGKIYLAPEFELEHSGDSSWTGSYGHHVRVKEHGALKACVMELKAGREKLSSLNDLCEEWDNPWAAGPDMLSAVAALARNSRGPILEIGSGLTTLVMAAANQRVPVDSVEHDPEWKSRIDGLAIESGLTNITIGLSPIVDGWYDFIPSRDYSLVVCDGPPRNLGSRKHFFDRFPSIVEDAVVVVDDVEDPVYLSMVNEWAAKSGHDVFRFGRFAICRPPMRLRAVA